MEKMTLFEDQVLEKKDGVQNVLKLMNSLRSNLNSIEPLLVNFDVYKIDELINLCQVSFKACENFLINNREDFKEINFLDNIHILKNHFGVIIGFCYFIKNGEAESDEEIKTFIGYMKKAVVKSHELLKINEADQKKEMVDANINSIVGDLLERFNIEALNKNIKFENKIENVEIKTDPKVLATSLENLISNAIKFSNPNGVIDIWSEKKDDIIKIYVKDHGVGIPQNRLNNFFEQLGSTSIGTGGEAGTGVGMYTCKKLLNIIGGDIEVESEESKGSTFIISLPLNTNL